MQVPEQVVVDRDPLTDEAFAVIDEQPDVELNAGQLRRGQRLDAFSQRRARNRQSVNDVGLAAVARRDARWPSASSRPGSPARR